MTTTTITLHPAEVRLIQELRDLDASINQRRNAGAKPSTHPQYGRDLERRDRLSREIGMNVMWDWEAAQGAA